MSLASSVARSVASRVAISLADTLGDATLGGVPSSAVRDRTGTAIVTRDTEYILVRV